jgi:nucleoid-associated protein YgaU
VTAVAQAPTDTSIVTVEHNNLRQEATPTPNLQPLVEVETAEPRVFEEPLGSYSAPLTWLVRPGDHLWKIAGSHLNIVLDRPPTRDEHASYWVEVVNAARPIIHSGDPDLIYPGEEIPLPPTLDAGVRP